MSKAVLLVNLGSPDSPAVPDVRRYLNEFLMDGRVIDTPWLVRRVVVGLILINQADGVAWLGIHVALIAMALLLAKHNKLALLKKW